MRKRGKRLFADVRDVAEYLDCRRTDEQGRHSALWRTIGRPDRSSTGNGSPTSGNWATPASSLFMLLGMFDCAVMLSLDDVCKATGYKKSTAYVASSAGTFPIPMRSSGKRLYADVRDVADYLDGTFATVKRDPRNKPCEVHPSPRLLGTEAYALLSMRFGPGLMDLDTVCLSIAWKKSTTYNSISAGNFPVFMRKFGRSWMADPRDVGFFLDEERARLRRPSIQQDEAQDDPHKVNQVQLSGLVDERRDDTVDENSGEEAAARKLHKSSLLGRQRGETSTQEAIRAILDRKAQKRKC